MCESVRESESVGESKSVKGGVWENVGERVWEKESMVERGRKSVGERARVWEREREREQEC